MLCRCFGLLAGAIALAAGSQLSGQSAWNQPSTIGPYRPVASAGYPLGRQEPGEPAIVSPSDWNEAQQGTTQAVPPQGSGDCGCDTAGARYPGLTATGNGPCNYLIHGSSGGGYRGPDGEIFDSGYSAGYAAACAQRSRGTGFPWIGPGSCGLGGGNNQVNTVVGVSALIFRRDLEDDRGLSYNAGSARLLTTDSDPGTMGGVEAMIGRRRCDGRGWEGRYWGLYPRQSDITLTGTPYTVLTGTSDLFLIPNGTAVRNIYDRAFSHRLYRDNSFTNVEINSLRNAGSFADCRGNYELLGGFRWFQFDEDLRYAAFSSWPGHPTQFNYDNSVRNTLLGGQIGGRSERCLGDRFRLATGVSAGIYNNRIRARQCMCDPNSGALASIYTGPFNGSQYNFSTSKNDLAILAELNAGLWYMLAPSCRVGVGYRVVGVSGVALAADQIPYNFADQQNIERIDSNGSLLLHGATAGLQFSY